MEKNHYLFDHSEKINISNDIHITSGTTESFPIQNLNSSYFDSQYLIGFPVYGDLQGLVLFSFNNLAVKGPHIDSSYLIDFLK